MERTVNNFRQTNAFAMQYGLLLGGWGLLNLFIMILSFSQTFLSVVNTLMFIGSPVVATLLALRFRRNVTLKSEVFTLGRGFVFSLMMGIYAALWIAAGVFVYLSYFDHGYVFDVYEQMLKQPQVVKELSRNGFPLTMPDGSVLTPEELVAGMRGISAANYAGLIIYITVLSAPIFSLVIGLICRRTSPLKIER